MKTFINCEMCNKRLNCEMCNKRLNCERDGYMRYQNETGNYVTHCTNCFIREQQRPDAIRELLKKEVKPVNFQCVGKIILVQDDTIEIPAILEDIWGPHSFAISMARYGVREEGQPYSSIPSELVGILKRCFYTCSKVRRHPDVIYGDE